MSFTWTSYDQRGGGGGGGMPPLPSLPPWATENAAPSSAAAAPAFSSPSTEVNGPGWRRPTSYFGAMKRLPGSRPLERVAVDDARDDNDGGGGQRDEHSGSPDTPPASMTNQADEGSDAALDERKEAEEKQRVKDELEQHGDDTGYKFRRLIQRYRDALPAFQRAGNPSVGSSSTTQAASSVLPVNLSATPRLSVFVRKRPLAKKELQAKGYDVLTCLFTGSSTSAKSFLRRSLVCHEPKLKVDCSETLEHHEFRFDGKTYTMKSIYRQAACDLFERLQSTASASSCVVGVSFYEIYMNHVNDLLQGRTRIQLLEDGDGVVQLLGLKEVMISNADELMTVIATGEEARATSANAVHDDSSRSHALLRVTLYGPAPKSTASPIVAARLCLVDLAGSERACDTQSDGKHTRMEGAEVNKSLLALKECIRALDRGAAHVPFRQSKLTQLLRDTFLGSNARTLLRDTFLGSNARTVMIATVSPWSESCNHTLNTLRYADRLKEIGGEQRRGAT
ncbi:hypothetical protein P43SY_006175 [Pythium insidiosum]|uniref:Kinesin-like protein n=1 Tax=Pythium insidiosum TaxID=114742 RepID=A0AAD5Q9F3_PYTIN|nr:hypothetical protein P43SY_006175 [Pythium insidiosum]